MGFFTFSLKIRLNMMDPMDLAFQDVMKIRGSAQRRLRCMRQVVGWF